MESEAPISMLMFGTLVAVLIIAIVLFLRFMRKSQNRHPMEGERERNIEEIRRDGADNQQQTPVNDMRN